MISPTYKQIRSDPEGSGLYGASRGQRLHNGVDYLCEKGQAIIAPFDLVVLRIAYPYRDMSMEGIEWQKGESKGYLFYFKPNKELVGKVVKQGETLGYAQSISEYYNLPLMDDHVHFQIYK